MEKKVQKKKEVLKYTNVGELEYFGDDPFCFGMHLVNDSKSGGHIQWLNDQNIKNKKVKIELKVTVL